VLRALRLLGLLPLLLLLLVVPGVASAAGTDGNASCADATEVPTGTNAETIRTATLCLVNRERTRRDRHALKRDATLERVASAYSELMVQDEFFDHVSPAGSTLTKRIDATSYLKHGVRRWSLGENLAWGTGSLATPAKIVAAWMQSPGHRRNILDPSFREAGFGVATGVPGRGFSRAAATYTNVFGQRVGR
jgi:uncharacterized protein YkwD